MSINFIKRLGKYTKNGKYYFSVDYRSTDDNGGWKTEVIEFDNEVSCDYYISKFYNKHDFVPLPYSSFDKISKRLDRFPKEERSRMLIYLLKRWTNLSMLVNPNNTGACLKRNLIYLPKQERYDVSFSFSTYTDNIPYSHLFSLDEIVRLRRENPEIVHGLREVYYGHELFGDSDKVNKGYLQKPKSKGH